jgi:hypothetical protein
MKSLLAFTALSCAMYTSGAYSAETDASATTNKITAAQVTVEPDCATAEFPLPPIAGVNPPPPLTSGGGAAFPAALVPVVAGLVGDVASSGIKAIASALADASKAKAIGGEGAATFSFYASDSKGEKLESRVTRGFEGCLQILVTPTPKQANASWALAGRFALETTDDAFVITPVHLRYDQALPGLSATKARPVELHAVFSIPSKRLASEGDAETFAVARIRLPAMKVGDELHSDRLEGYSSHAMPLRPAVSPIPPPGSIIGSTTVLARMVMLKDASAFGQSLATALDARAATAGTAVASAAEQAINPDGFTEADAAYSLALVTVRQKDAALKQATAAGDAVAINAADLALAEAKGQANIKAAAAKRRLPYPDLLN